MNLDNFKVNLRKARERKGYSQTQLANELGLKSISTVSGWESGQFEPTLNKLIEICNILSVTPDDLVLGSDDRQLSSDESELMEVFGACSDEAKDSILTNARLLSGTAPGTSTKLKPIDKSRIFLRKTDPDYERMSVKVTELSEIRKSVTPHRSHADIAAFLRRAGLSGYISELDIKVAFLKKPRKVPSEELYEYIKSYLLDKYEIAVYKAD